MKLIATALLAATGCLALSGCPAKEAKDGLQSINQATGVQCVTERDMMEKAVEAYTLLTTAAPVNEASMVPDWIREQSVLMDLDATGHVVAAPNSGCA
ncbi:MAG TPA: hypothetical protein PK020_04500 [Ilumatobacteraceae bacterium]|nr:hypothetical protein [Ilumatobacteraceae bacterium]HRB04018.1 hypothetical protein [Ilumatobacteraceae bacterium]